LVAKWGKWVSIPTPAFPYQGGKDATGRQRRTLQEAWAAGTAVSYRFCRRDNGRWYLQATVEGPRAKAMVTIPASGAIGVDLNADHVATAELDRFGNPISVKRIPVMIYKRSHAQIEACLGDVVKEVVEAAKKARKPLVAERLELSSKRSRLREAGGSRYARMLSGFAYATFSSLLRARCDSDGVELILVNPAYTSLIGLVKFASGYGITSHQAAAITIARRGIGDRRKVCRCGDRRPCRHDPRPKGLGEALRTKARNAPPLPARNRGRHVWSDWRRNSKRLRADFALGRCPPEGGHGGGGGSPPSLVAHAPEPEEGTGTRPTVREHETPVAVVTPGCDSLAQVGNAVRPAKRDAH
jgi:IS605 OrfB family transposase